jgi:hypothetical protein
MSQNHFHPVVLYSEDAKQVYDALVSSGHNDLALKIATKAKRTKTDKKYADAVRLWDEGDFDIDDEPVVSRGEDGAYVIVWQWIYKNAIRKRTKESA